MFFTNQSKKTRPMSKSQLDKMLKELEKEIFGNSSQKSLSHQKPYKAAA